MKKILSFLMVSATVLILSACDFSLGGDEEKQDLENRIEDLEKALEEKETGDTETEDAQKQEKPDEETDAEDAETPDEEDTAAEEDTPEEEDEPEPYTGQNYITLNSPANEQTFYELPVIFKGVVSPNTTKIVVTASGGSHDPDAMFPYYEDVYRLQDFDYGDTAFTYRAQPSWNNMILGSNDYEFKAYFDDDTSKATYVTIYYSPGGAEIAKPVVYLYPEETTEIFVNVEPTGGISVSDPEIYDGWKVIATPEGKILNLSDYKIYPYLFWEGFSVVFDTPEEGFVVSASEIENFFDEKLSYLGLNETEIKDFKEFWVPKFSDYPYYFLTFIPQEQFDKYAPLTVSPTPDSVIRVMFDYKGLDKKIEVKEQELTPGVREGFTVIEWGGRIY